MKQIITVCLLLLFTTSFAQRNLIVKKNQTKNIATGTRSLVLDTLILEDNAKLVIAENVQAFSVSANYVIIGTNVTIDGRRTSNVLNGENGSAGVNSTVTCRSGGNGKSGKVGAAGLNAADISLFLSIRSIGSLKIMVEGSKGGNGGDGGNGGIGGDGKMLTCIVGSGGNGGTGGNGGNGGAGGHVIMNYRIIDETGNTSSRQTQLNEVQVSFGGGAGGNAGNGGLAGKNGKPVAGGIYSTKAHNGISGLKGMQGLDGYYQRTVTRY